TGVWCSSNHWSTPICARPSAPPPSSATPIFGRVLDPVVADGDSRGGFGLGGSWSGADCARTKRDSREKNRTEEKSLRMMSYQEEVSLPGCRDRSSNILRTWSIPASSVWAWIRQGCRRLQNSSQC